MTVTAGKRKNKAYAFSNGDNSISKALANPVLALTDREVKTRPSTVIKSTSQSQVGDTVRELIETGIIKLSDSRPLDDNK